MCIDEFILEWFLKDDVTLKTGVKPAENLALHKFGFTYTKIFLIVLIVIK